jgi:hypothetical protein
MRKINKLSFPWNQTPDPLKHEDCPYHWITIINIKNNLQLIYSILNIKILKDLNWGWSSPLLLYNNEIFYIKTADY